MTNIVTTTVIITIALALFLVGLYLGKKALYISTAGAIMFMILGISLFPNPIEYQSGAIVSENSTHIVIENTYTNTEPTLNYLIALVLTILGFGGVITSLNMINKFTLIL